MTSENYIYSVLRHVKNKAARHEIREELENHIEERMQYFIDSGYDADSAEEKAVSRMGDADETGKRFNRLTNYYPAIFGAVLMIILMLLCLSHYYYGHNWIDFAIVSPDPELSWAGATLVSCTAFIASALAFRIIYKNKLSFLSIIYGVISIIIGAVSFWIYQPAGAAAIRFFTDFLPGLFNADYKFFGSFFGEGLSSIIDNWQVVDAISYFAFSIIGLFSLTGVVLGISAIVFGIKAIKNSVTDKNKKDLSRLVALTSAIAIMCGAAFTLESAGDAIKHYNKVRLSRAGLSIDCREAQSYFDSLAVPMTIDEIRQLNDDLEADHYLTEAEDYSALYIFPAQKFQICVNDLDGDGVFESKDITLNPYYLVSFDEVKKISDEGMTSAQVLDKFSLGRINYYSYEMTDDGVIEIFKFDVIRNNPNDKEKSDLFVFHFKNGIRYEV